MRILLIEDDKRLTALIKKVLEQEKMNVDVAHDGDIGLELVLRGIYDVAVIDWMLPGRDGPSICRSVRSARLKTALLMLTARTQVEDRVAGLYSGADDYLLKPFSFEELIARVRTLGRRFTDKAVDSWELRVGDLVMDLHALTARRGSLVLDLTKTEWDLLECLMRHPGQILNREFIIDYVWSYDSQVKPTLVDVYISYLRNKIDQPGLRNPIQTKRGMGYYLDKDRA
jgi:two-component system OmpR family response regulator